MPDLQPVLVTGGAGYVGSHTCKALRNAGFLPIVYDNLSTGHTAAVKWGPLEQGELIDGGRLDEVIETHRPKAVLHFAALAYVGESVEKPSAYYHTNIGGTLSLLDAMRRHAITPIVFSSTCATYGIPEKLPICEKQPQEPVNPYGHTKLAVERMLRDFEPAYATRSAVLRYFNAAGADPDGEIGEDHQPEPHLIPNVLAAADGGRPLVIHGRDYTTADGTCIRDYVHVTDLATAHVAALNRLLAGSTSFACNLGTEQGASVLQIIKAAEAVTGCTVAHEFGARRPGDPPVLVADTSLARRLLDWRPQHSDLPTIMKTAWHWHRTGYAKDAA